MTGSPGITGEALLSVILAVREVAEYLPGCLDSILGQPDLPAGIEVIAVDDAAGWCRVPHGVSSWPGWRPTSAGTGRRGIAGRPGLRGLKTALICRDSYRAYAMLAPVNHARVMARRVLADAG